MLSCSFAERREEVVAETEIEGQLLGDLPVVLNVGRDRTESRAILLHDILREAALVDLTDEEAGIGEAGVRGSGDASVGRWIEGCRLSDGGGDGKRTGATGVGCDLYSSQAICPPNVKECLPLFHWRLSSKV